MLRPPHPDEMADLTELCLRSKAHWGYDAAFMSACRGELTLTEDDLHATTLAVSVEGDHVAGLAQIAVKAEVCDLLKLFVEPACMGRGHGRTLFTWSVTEARRLGDRRMTIEADPDARPFYEAMGARLVGTAPSGSISGRVLPLLVMPLTGR